MVLRVDVDRDIEIAQVGVNQRQYLIPIKSTHARRQLRQSETLDLRLF